MKKIVQFVASSCLFTQTPFVYVRLICLTTLESFELMWNMNRNINWNMHSYYNCWCERNGSNESRHCKDTVINIFKEPESLKRFTVQKKTTDLQKNTTQFNPIVKLHQWITWVCSSEIFPIRQCDWPSSPFWRYNFDILVNKSRYLLGWR